MFKFTVFNNKKLVTDPVSEFSEKKELKDFLQIVKKALINISINALSEEQAKGFDKKPVRLVDRRATKHIRDVSPLGSVRYISRSSNISEIILSVYKAVVDRSPSESGTFSKLNYVFVNGTQVATDLASLKSWLATEPELGPKDQIRIANLAPYARRLERLGVSKGRKKSKLVSRASKSNPGTKFKSASANGTYFLAYRSIYRKYGGLFKVRFTFLSGSSFNNLPILSRDGKELRRTFSAKNNKKSSAGRPYLYPTIVINFNDKGIAT